MSSKPGATSIHRALDSTTKTTSTSEIVLKLKESKTEYLISWDIIGRMQPYLAVTNRCNLYIAEKYFFLKTKPNLNKRREIFSSTERSICYKTSSGPETKNNSPRSERQPTHLIHTRRERRTSDTFVLRLKNQCRMKRI